MSENKIALPSPEKFLTLWDSLTIVQRTVLVCEVAFMTGNNVRRVLFIVAGLLAIASLVWLASESWPVALAVGIVIGWLMRELYKKL